MATKAVTEQDKHKITVWSTKAVNDYLNDIDNGIERKDSPFLYGNTQLRKPNLMFEYTQEEIEIIMRCKNDINFFANKFAYTMNPSTGSLNLITLRDYQEDLLNTINDNRFTVIVASRQCGKTISSSIYLAWYILFNYDKTAFLCGNIEKTAVDILGKVVDVIKNVPFFMKPGVIKGSSLEWKFDNGCRLMGAATTKRAGIGFTIHCLYLDEFAHVDKGIIDEFFDNIYPTVSSLPDSKIIVTSTPNGMNRFYHIYDAATKGINQFTPFRIDWWQVPDWDKEKRQWVLRGEDWMEKQIAQLGNGDEELGKERFGAQFGNSFLSTGNLLLGPNALKRLEESREVFVHKPLPIFEDYDIDEYSEFVWKEDFDVENVKRTDEQFLFSIDLAEGNGGDNTVINIFKVRIMDKNDWANITVPNSVYDYVGLEQVGLFAHNRIHLQQFTKMLYILLHDVFNTENTKVVLEWNAFGGEVYNGLSHVFGDRNDFDSSCVLKFKRSLDGMRFEPGLRLNHDTKLIYCHNAKKNIGSGRMILHEEGTIGEFNIFGRVKSSYAAITDHDDKVMTCVNANAFFENRDFSWIADLVLERNPELASELTGMINVNDDSVYGGFADIYKQTSAVPNIDWHKL